MRTASLPASHTPNNRTVCVTPPPQNLTHPTPPHTQRRSRHSTLFQNQYTPGGRVLPGPGRKEHTLKPPWHPPHHTTTWKQGTHSEARQASVDCKSMFLASRLWCGGCQVEAGVLWLGSSLVSCRLSVCVTTCIPITCAIQLLKHTWRQVLGPHVHLCPVKVALEGCCQVHVPAGKGQHQVTGKDVGAAQVDAGTPGA